MADRIQGRVVSITDAGAAITDIPLDRLKDVPRDESVAIECEGHRTLRLFDQEHGQPAMTFLALLGPSGFLELHLTEDSVATFLGITLGSEVTIRW